jgi:hypothetical protein
LDISVRLSRKEEIRRVREREVRGGRENIGMLALSLSYRMDDKLPQKELNGRFSRSFYTRLAKHLHGLSQA